MRISMGISMWRIMRLGEDENVNEADDEHEDKDESEDQHVEEMGLMMRKMRCGWGLR